MADSGGLRGDPGAVQSFMSSYSRVVLAFVVAPLSCGPVFVVGNFAVLLLVDGASAFRDLLGLSLGAVMIVVPVAYGAAAILGIPALLVLRAANRLTGMYVVSSAGIAGLTLAALFSILTLSVQPMHFIAGVSGTVAAWVWWRIAAGSWALRHPLVIF